jgi:hypothetical protein
VDCGNGDQFLVELTLGTEESDQESGKISLLARVYDAIDAVHSPDFFVSLRTKGSPDAELNKRRLINELTTWLADLKYNDILQVRISDSRCFPKYDYTEKGLTLKFVAVPKGPKARGDPSIRTLGATSLGARWSRTQRVIESRLRDKVNRYGNLEIPYVVGLNVLTMTMDGHDIVNALFGPVKVPVDSHDDEPMPGQPYREPGGVWLGKNGRPTNRRVSGALIVRGLRAWNLGRVRWRLYHNPWASQPLPQGLLRVPEATLSADQLQLSHGAELWETLSLWDGWPVTEPQIYHDADATVSQRAVIRPSDDTF